MGENINCTDCINCTGLIGAHGIKNYDITIFLNRDKIMDKRKVRGQDIYNMFNHNFDKFKDCFGDYFINSFDKIKCLVSSEFGVKQLFTIQEHKNYIETQVLDLCQFIESCEILF
jgi:hypothetical protein